MFTMIVKHLTKDHINHKMMKHVDVRYHLIHDVIAQGDILVKKIGTIDNPVDMITKSLPFIKFSDYVNRVVLCNM